MNGRYPYDPYDHYRNYWFWSQIGCLIGSLLGLSIRLITWLFRILIRLIRYASKKIRENENQKNL